MRLVSNAAAREYRLGESAAKGITYLIDGYDDVIHVDWEWELFALENGAPELVSKHVIGRSLWDFISDDSTRELWKAIFHRVRFSGDPVTVPFRCDSPELRRFMKLRVVPAGQELLVSSYMVREEPRAHQPLLGGATFRNSHILGMCSWCKRVKVSASRWLEVEDAMISLGLAEGDALPRIDHCVCGNCRKQVETPHAWASGVCR